MKSKSTHPFKISGPSARALIFGPPGAPTDEPGKYRSEMLAALLHSSHPRPAGFDSPYTFAGNWSEPEFVVKKDPALMKYLQVRDWLQPPRWVQDGRAVILILVLVIAALALMYRLGSLLSLGFFVQILAPLGVTGIGLYAFITSLDRLAWKQALATARPALKWRATHADSVLYIGNLPAPETEQPAQLRKAPGIRHHDVWDCALLLQEKAPLVSFLNEYSRLYTRQEPQDALVEKLGGKLTAATSRVQEIDKEIQARATYPAAIHAAL